MKKNIYNSAKARALNEYFNTADTISIVKESWKYYGLEVYTRTFRVSVTLPGETDDTKRDTFAIGTLFQAMYAVEKYWQNNLDSGDKNLLAELTGVDEEILSSFMHKYDERGDYDQKVHKTIRALLDGTCGFRKFVDIQSTKKLRGQILDQWDGQERKQSIFYMYRLLGIPSSE